jgi:NAD(P)-dependent dehydrogenase (short-subunit alcohol dehydrogenase family)
MATHFTGQVVWITGASSGIGEALAYAFSANGARVILSRLCCPILWSGDPVILRS